jgi:hypothetical protein
MEIEAHPWGGQGALPVWMTVITTPQVASAPTGTHWAFAELTEIAAMPRINIANRVIV